MFSNYFAQSFHEYKTSTGLNPFHYAYALGNHEIINQLTIRCVGSQLDCEDPQNLTLLSKYVTERNLPQNFTMATRLLSRGADINYRSSAPYGRTALHRALQLQISEGVNYLLDRPNINVHMEDFNGRDCCDLAKSMPHTFQR